MPRVTRKQKEAGHPAAKPKPRSTSSSSRPSSQAGPSRSFVSSRPAIRGTGASSKPFNHSKPSSSSASGAPRQSAGAAGDARRADRAGPAPGEGGRGGGGGEGRSRDGQRERREGGKVRSSNHPPMGRRLLGKGPAGAGSSDVRKKFSGDRDRRPRSGPDDKPGGERRKSGFKVGPAHAPRNAYLGKGTSMPLVQPT